MKKIRQQIGLWTQNVPLKILLIVVLLNLSHLVYCQDDYSLDKILIKINHELIMGKEVNYKFISVFISKDTIVTIKNDFLTINEKIIPLLNEIRKLCKKNIYISLVGSNRQENMFMKLIILKNLDYSFTEMSKNDEYFEHKFFNLSKFIWIEK